MQYKKSNKRKAGRMKQQELEQLSSGTRHQPEHRHIDKIVKANEEQQGRY